MPERISIEQASRITGFSAEEIRDWAKSNKIRSYSYKDGEPLVNIVSLQNYASKVKRIQMEKLYLQEIIEDKEEEINEIIAQYDDYLFFLRSITKISPLLKIIIDELATFIEDKKSRYIFTAISGGTKVLDVAKHCGSSYDSMCQRYVTIVSRLASHTGFMLDYRKTIADKDLEIERITLENRNLRLELNKLYKESLKAGFKLPKPQIHIPADAAKLLRKPISMLTLSSKPRKALQSLSIETIEDLLRYAKTTGLDSLLKLPGFGKLSLEELKFQLEKHKILNKNGDSELFQYIPNINTKFEKHKVQ